MSCVPFMMFLKNKTENKVKDRYKGVMEIQTELSKKENKNNIEKHTKDTDLCLVEEENKKA